MPAGINLLALACPEVMNITYLEKGTAFSYYASEKDISIHIGVAGLALNEAFGYDFRRGVQMPGCCIPSNEDEIELTLRENGEPFINFFRAFGDYYHAKIQIEGKERIVQTIKPSGTYGMFKEFPEEGQGKSRIMVACENPFFFLGATIEEYLHYLVKPFTCENFERDPRVVAANSVKTLITLDDLDSLVVEEWTAREEGIVHGFVLFFMKEFDKKYHLKFAPELEKANNICSSLQIYRYAPLLKRKFEEKGFTGVREIVEAYKNNPDNLFG